MTALTHLRVASRQAGHRVFAVLNDLAFIGSRPTDSEDEKLRKALLMGGSLMILPVAIVWGCLYLAYDERWAALITLSYAAANGTAIIYQPFLSLRDGSLAVPEDGTVYDFTVYPEGFVRETTA
mgnify:CR=1 FL=1